MKKIVFYFKQLLVGACLIITEFSPPFLSISLNRQDILFCSNEGTLKMLKELGLLDVHVVWHTFLLS